MSRSWLVSLVKPGPVVSFDDINVTKRPPDTKNVWSMHRPLLIFSQRKCKAIPLQMLQSSWESKKPQMLYANFKPEPQRPSSAQTRWPQPPKTFKHQKNLMFSAKRGGCCPAPAIDGSRSALTSRLNKKNPSEGARLDMTPESTESVKTPRTLGRGKTKLIGVSRVLLSFINPRSKILRQDSEHDVKKDSSAMSMMPKTIFEPISKSAELKFSVVEEQVLQRYFTLRDVDNSSSLSFDELMLVIDDLGRLPPRDSEYWPLLMKLREEFDQDGNGELDFKEFTTFIAAYYKTVYLHIFKKHDTEGDEVVNLLELDLMLQDLNNAGFVAQSKNLSEMLRLVDSDCNDLVDFSEFCELMKHYRILEFGQLKKNAGFSADELAMYTRAFESCDDDDSGTIDIREVISLFHSLGKPVLDVDRFVRLFRQMDVDRTASLDFEEFVRLLKVWEKEKQRARTAPNLENNEEGTSHTVRQRVTKISELELIAPNEIDLSPKDLEEKRKSVATLLEREAVGADVEDGVFAAHWDIPLWEVRALRESFEYSDTDGSGVIDSHDELDNILSCVGIDTTTGMQHKVLERWKSSAAARGVTLDFQGVVKFYSQYSSLLARIIYESMGCAGRTMPVGQVVAALYQVGQYLTKQQVVDVLQKVGAKSIEDVSEATFLKLLKDFQSNSIAMWIEHCGFSDSELLEFKKVFIEQTNGTNRLELDRVLEVLEVLERAPIETTRQSSVLSALTRVDRSGSGFVGFREFLLLMRHLQNYVLHEYRKEEAKAAEAIGLDEESTTAFRRMFRGYSEDRVSQNPQLSQLVLKHLLIIDLDVVKTSEQRDHLDKLLQQYSSFTFLQFLQFMCQLDATGVF